MAYLPSFFVSDKPGLVQCVVEDCLLRLPTNLRMDFDNPQGIRFLTEDKQDDFEAGYFEYLKEKSSTVMKFIVILEQAYIVERRREKKLFQLFESAGYSKYLPDFNKMREDAIAAIDELSNACSKEQRKELQQIIVQSLHPSYRDRACYSLRGLFEERKGGHEK